MVGADGSILDFCSRSTLVKFFFPQYLGWVNRGKLRNLPMSMPQFVLTQIQVEDEDRRKCRWNNMGWKTVGQMKKEREKVSLDHISRDMNRPRKVVSFFSSNVEP